MYLLKAWTYGLLTVAWLCCSSLLIGAQDTRITNPDEVKALKAIKSRLIDPNGNLGNWDRGDPCTSNWTGIVCYYDTTLDDGNLRLHQLSLLNMNLSGTLAPELGQLSNLTILDFMWNNISGSIPKEIGNITSLILLLLNGNQLTGPLPEELGYLPYLDRIQIDQNHISGPLPKSFAFLKRTKHFHMNNNSISGQIPPELSRLPMLVHFLLDNNNLSGYLPPQFSELPNLLIIQLDNNNFDGTTIPASFGNMSKLLKLSLRNCSLQGPIPDLSQIPQLGYIDLSSNQLNGTIPQNRLSAYITTIDLSNNKLTGTIPTNFSGLPLLQKLSLAKNSLSGSVPSAIWGSRTWNAKGNLIVELQDNNLSNISGSTVLPSDVTLWLQGNPLCSSLENLRFCLPANDTQSLTNSTSVPIPTVCPPSYECSSYMSREICFCATPLIVKYRLKSPGFTDFRPFINDFEAYMTGSLYLLVEQLDFKNLWAWEGPRLKITLKFFPQVTSEFNISEILRIKTNFTSWQIPDSDVFGPYELLGLNLPENYSYGVGNSPSSGISKDALAGIVVGTIAGAVILCVIVYLLILRVHKHHAVSKRRHPFRTTMKIDGMKDFTYGDMALATNNFNSSAQVGQGGYGKVYKGILADGTLVAIKRAQEGSLQGEREFLTEIELLSRLHHRNLVSLIGFCDEEGEQMLVYEFMPNGTLRDHLFVKSKEPLSFAMRLKIALGSSKGILYLHTEADPPIFHRDIKTSNILLDSKYTAKVADFGLSRLAPVPNIEGDLPAHVSTIVKGTPGYLDPEYFLTHKLTDKSDVYSLGVVFLELLTGMHPISQGKNIVREVNVAYQSSMIFSIIDDRMGSYPSECVVKFLTLALKCCEDETDARPSMAEVVRELENIWLLMPDSNIKTADPMLLGSEKAMTSPSSSSSSMVKNPFVSSDVSGNDLVSGVVPSITPRLETFGKLVVSEPEVADVLKI